MEIKNKKSEDRDLEKLEDFKNQKLQDQKLVYGLIGYHTVMEVSLFLLLLALLLGYGLPYEKPEQPQRDYRADYESAEEEGESC